MIDQIQSEFKKIVLKFINKYAKEKSQSPDNVQLILGMKEGEVLNAETKKREIGIVNSYSACVDYVKKDEYTINKIMGIPDWAPDFSGKSKMAEAFILKSLVNFARAQESLDVNVMCVKSVDENGKDEIRLFLYKGMSQFVEEIDIERLLNADDLADILQM